MTPEPLATSDFILLFPGHAEAGDSVQESPATTIFENDQ
jgi:hypothetical protein